MVKADSVGSDFGCAFATNCDLKAGFPALCVGGGDIVLNGSSIQGSCALGVEGSTWSVVKQLYR